MGLMIGVIVGGIAQAPARAQVAGTATGGTAGRSSENAPAGEIRLGVVKLSRNVLANGQVLAAGSYEVRVTPQPAAPEATGATPGLERWPEFLQNGQVKGREVVTIVPASEIGRIAKEPPPPEGRNRVEMLKGNNYLRVWMNRGSSHYFFHLPPA
jgi:hypothetical protein